MAKVIGSLVYQSKQFVLSQHGQETHNKILEMLDDETKKIFTSPILSGQWYELKAYSDYLTAFEKIVGREELKKMAEFNIKKMFLGFYGLLLKFVSLEKAVNQGPKWWPRTYSEGRSDVHYQDDRHFDVTIRGFGFISPALLYGFMYYMQVWAEIITGKKFTASLNRIDNKNTEFHFSAIEKQSEVRME